MDIILFYASTLLYLATWIICLVFSGRKSESMLKTTNLLLLLGWVLHLTSFASRFIIYGYFPVASLYETLVFISFVMMSVFLFLKYKFKIEKLGVIFIGAVLLLNFSTLFMGKEAGIAASLQTLWLMIHVPFGLISYGFFTISFILGLLYLATHYKKGITKNKLELYYKIIFRLVTFGFIFLSLCIVMGAIWANFAWGSFWGWDPKETWSLITWFTYLVCILFYSLNKKRKTVNVAISTASFMLVIFNYLGVNLLIYGLHSYI